MKLRRALATAAAAAAVGPAAVLAAPCAFAAAGGPATTAPARVSAPAQAPDPVPAPAPGSAPPSAAPEPGPSATGAGADAGADTAAHPAAPEPAAAPAAALTPASAAPAASEPKSPSPSGPSGSPAAAPGASRSAAGTCRDHTDRPWVTTELRGLPREIVAGSGWHAFAYRAANTSDRVIASLSASVELRSWDRKNLQDETTKHITVQWYDSRTRRWEPLPADHGYFARTTGLGPRASADASLRLRIDAAAPAGSGVAFQTGFFSDQDRTCGYAAGAHYSFAVLTAGSRLSTDEDARATAAGPEKAAAPTTTVNRPAPQGIPADAPATGKLASTGASSSSPLLLGVAGATIAVGAVAVAVARRGRDR